MPWQWSPWAWVTITASRRPPRPQATAGASPARNRRAALAGAFDQDRRAQPIIARFGGIAAAPVIADLRDAGRRAATEDPKLHPSALLKSLKKFAVVVSASASDPLPSARPRRPRCRRRMPARTSARDAGPARGMASPSRPASGRPAATSPFPADRCAFLNVTMPESEMKKPRSRPLRARSAEPVKQ